MPLSMFITLISLKKPFLVPYKFTERDSQFYFVLNDLMWVLYVLVPNSSKYGTYTCLKAEFTENI